MSLYTASNLTYPPSLIEVLESGSQNEPGVEPEDIGNAGKTEKLPGETQPRARGINLHRARSCIVLTVRLRSAETLFPSNYRNGDSHETAHPDPCLADALRSQLDHHRQSDRGGYARQRRATVGRAAHHRHRQQNEVDHRGA